MDSTMKKIIKAIILLPLWPLIWVQIGFNLKGDCYDGLCHSCSLFGGCCQRAKAMVKWYKK